MIKEKMMTIALIVTLGGDLVRSTEHVGVGYLAAFLRERGYRVKVIEINERDLSNESTYMPLLEDCHLIGFTTTCVTMKNIIKLSKVIKNMYTNLPIVYGGHMATFGGLELMQKYNELDYIIIGEGEYTFYDLLEALQKDHDLSKILGLGYRKEGKVVINENRPLIKNLDSLPFPHRDQFEQHGRNFQYLRISTSRGCLGNCGFCSSFAGRNQPGAKWRGRSAGNIVDEVESLVKRYEFRTFDFVDSTFEDPGKEGKKRIEAIAKELINRKLNIFYNCCFRAENWDTEDKNLLKLLVQSGLEKVNIGFECGNDKGLKYLNKRATMHDNWRVINLLRTFPEIYVTFGFVMLHPYSSIHDLEDNATFLHDTGIGQVIRHYFWILEVYHGTLLEKKLKADNLLDKEYDIDDGMYKYHFVDKDMEEFKKIFTQMLTLTLVWDFEIFDILIHTFITRLIKKYSGTSVMKEITIFNKFITKSRHEIADFNYEFFQNILNNYRHYNIKAEKNRLNSFILIKMKEIRSEQYKLGINLRRRGISITIK